AEFRIAESELGLPDRQQHINEIGVAVVQRVRAARDRRGAPLVTFGGGWPCDFSLRNCHREFLSWRARLCARALRYVERKRFASLHFRLLWSVLSRPSSAFKSRTGSASRHRRRPRILCLPAAFCRRPWRRSRRRIARSQDRRWFRRG